MRLHLLENHDKGRRILLRRVPALFMNASAAIADSPLGRSTYCFKYASLPRGLSPLVESPRRGHSPFETPRRGKPRLRLRAPVSLGDATISHEPS